MSPLADFLETLLRDGRAVVQARPEPVDDHDTNVLNLLHRAYDHYQLEIAGPRMEFDRGLALAAAALVHNACWFFVSRGEPEEVIRQVVVFPDPPSLPAAHLSVDLVLRFLPQVHRRANAVSNTDVLTMLLADVLRRWPLSGVLSDLEEGPLCPVDLGGHPGLQMLYAERLAQHEKPMWVPRSEQGIAYVEIVYEELGKDFGPLHHYLKTQNREIGLESGATGDE